MNNFPINLEWASKLFNTVKAGIIIIDPETRVVVDINNQALIMLGTRRENIINRSCQGCFVNNYGTKCPILDIGLDIEDEELLLQRDDGSKLIVSRTITTILCNNKRYLVESFLDITKLKENDERMSALLRISESILQSEEDIARFALDEAVKLTQSKIGYLHFVSEEGPAEELVSLSLFVWSSGVSKNCEVEQTPSYPLTKAGIWADCIRTRKPIVCNDYNNELNKKGYPEGHIPIDSFMSVPIINGNDDIVAVMGVGNKETPYVDFDVTQLQLFANSMWAIIKRKRVQIDLMKNERQYRRLVEQSPAAIYEIDLTNLDIITADGNIEGLSGFTKKELLEKDPMELLLPEDGIKFMNRVNKIAEGNKVSNRVEYRVRTKDGSVKNALLQVSHRKRESDGHIIAYVVASDITDLRCAEAKAETYFNLTPALIVVLDLEGNIKSLNKYGREILECDASVIGKNWFDLFIPNHEKKRILNVFQELLDGEVRFSEIENDVITAEGNNRVIAWRNTVLLSASGEIDSVIASGDDLTDQRLAERELEKHWASEELRLQKKLNQLSLLGKKERENGRI
jgi:PAS domain S-box-containing protein